ASARTGSALNPPSSSRHAVRGNIAYFIWEEGVLTRAGIRGDVPRTSGFPFLRLPGRWHCHASCNTHEAGTLRTGGSLRWIKPVEAASRSHSDADPAWLWLW